MYVGSDNDVAGSVTSCAVIHARPSTTWLALRRH